MNRIFITDDEKQTIIDVDKNIFKGCTFYYDGRVERITEKTFDIFKLFLLSNDQNKLPNEGEYEVILDNKTGLKHFFLDKKEDYMMLFLNNGSSAIEYNEDKKKSLIGRIGNRIFKFGKTVVCISLASLLLAITSVSIINGFYLATNEEGLQKLKDLHLPNSKIVQLTTLDSIERYLNENVDESVEVSTEIEIPVIIEDITVEEIMDGIYNKSPELSQENKDLIFNKDFFEDILNYVNASNASKILFREKFNNIIIKIDDDIHDGVAGYYDPSIPNVIWVRRDALEDPEWYCHIIIHELMHMVEGCDYYYNVICEACAEILSNEYYNSKEKTYSEERYLIKKLMEIIGVEPIKEYLYTGNFNSIRDSLKPYLSDIEYNSVLDTLHQPNKSDSNYSSIANHISHEICDLYLDFAFVRKYGIWPEEDIVMCHLKDKDLVRYYFNDRRNKNEGSYIYQSVGSRLKLEDAINYGLISVTTVDGDGKTRELTYDEFVSYRSYTKITVKSNVVGKLTKVFYATDGWTFEIKDDDNHDAIRVKIELPLPGERQIVNNQDDEQNVL